MKDDENQSNIIRLLPEHIIKEDTNAALSIFSVIVILLIAYSSYLYTDHFLIQSPSIDNIITQEKIQSFIPEKITKTKIYKTAAIAYNKTKAELVSAGPSVTLDDIITHEAKKHDIDVEKIVIKAIIEQESRYNPTVSKYEEKWKSKYYHKAKLQPGENIEAWKKNFSSIGLMQVGYILHKDFCGLNSPKDLYDPRKNIACGVKIYATCRKTKSRSECIKAYNGQGPGADKYRQEVLVRIAKLKSEEKKFS